jgi:hypothetical protein
MIIMYFGNYIRMGEKRTSRGYLLIEVIRLPGGVWPPPVICCFKLELVQLYHFLWSANYWPSSLPPPSHIHWTILPFPQVSEEEGAY